MAALRSGRATGAIVTGRRNLAQAKLPNHRRDDSRIIKAALGERTDPWPLRESRDLLRHHKAVEFLTVNGKLAHRQGFPFDVRD